MNLRELRIKNGIKAKELAEKVGTDEAMMSRFENYKCLPTPPTMAKLCDELSCVPTDIYDSSEMYYQAPAHKTKRLSRVNIVYHLTADLPVEAREWLKEHLTMMGYLSVTEWINDCYRALKEQYKNDFTHESLQATSEVTNQESI